MQVLTTGVRETTRNETEWKTERGGRETGRDFAETATEKDDVEKAEIQTEEDEKLN